LVDTKTRIDSGSYRGFHLNVRGYSETSDFFGLV